MVALSPCCPRHRLEAEPAGELCSSCFGGRAARLYPGRGSRKERHGRLPSSGWVRYAERVLGHPVTPHLCTARSPQQIMGSLVKDYFARRQVSWPCPEGQPAGQATSFHVDSGGWVGPGRLCGSCRLLVGPLILLVWGPGCLGGIWKVCGKTSSPAAACRCRGFGGNRPQLRPRPQGGAGSAGSAPSAQDLSADRIFHVIVAPCYDRKLEALQEDVPTASPGFRGTDCVLTSGEGGASGGTARGAASPSQHPVCVPSEGLAAGDKGTVCTCQGRCGWSPGGPCPWAGGESQQPLGAAGVPWDLKTHLVLPSVKR